MRLTDMRSECSKEIPGFGPADRSGQWDEKLQPSEPGLYDWFDKNTEEM